MFRYLLLLLLLFLACISVWPRKNLAVRFRLALNATNRISILHRTVTRTPSLDLTMSSAPSEPASLIIPSLPLPDPDKIDPEEVAEWLKNGGKNLVIVDVRDDDFVEGGHIKGCTNIPSTVFMEQWSSCDGLLKNYSASGEAQVINNFMIKSSSYYSYKRQMSSSLLANHVLTLTIMTNPDFAYLDFSTST